MLDGQEERTFIFLFSKVGFRVTKIFKTWKLIRAMYDTRGSTNICGWIFEF